MAYKSTHERGEARTVDAVLLHELRRGEEDLRVTSYKLHATSHKLRVVDVGGQPLGHARVLHLQLTSDKLTPRVGGYKLHATRYKLHATSYTLQATRYKLLATSYKLHATRYKLRVKSYWELDACICTL